MKAEHSEVLIQPLPFAAPPAVAFRAIAEERWAFFLDSALNGSLGRFSFFGVRPFLTFVSKGSRIEVQTPGDDVAQAPSPKAQAPLILRGNPFQVLRGLMQRYRLPYFPGLPPFVGGAVGYFGYDLRHFLERLPRRARDDLGFPECAVGFYDVVVGFDHLAGEGFIMSTGLPEREPRAARRRAKARLETFLLALQEGNGPPKQGTVVIGGPPTTRNSKPETRNWDGFASNFTRREYLTAIRRAKEYIAAGDIYQVNLSQRFEAPLSAPPFAVYEALREASPAPFAAFLNFPGVAVACGSPERFLRISGKRVQTRPIKGTRPRGKEPGEDEKLALELQSSAKDLAENTMIVDLERNDLGRACRYGSVDVTEFAALEAYANVFHLVSTVEGELQPGVGPLDCLAACFPGGSVTGAPKIRAMEIIDELEPTSRSLYTGAMGYLGWDGNMDLNIVIRTLLMAGGRGWFQVGGGIVADSEPEAEYQETLDKAAGLFTAVSSARKGEVAQMRPTGRRTRLLAGRAFRPARAGLKPCGPTSR